jgi:Uma2 family endonuclease
MRGTDEVDQDVIVVPPGVVDLESFHRWTESDEFPQEGRICYFQGELWIDMSQEQVFTHSGLKTEYCRVLANLAKEERRGFFITDGLRVSHPEANLSVVPDGTFTLFRSPDRGRVRLIEGKVRGFIRMEGIPDLLLEIVSDSSFQKDTVRLKNQYWQAGVPEYWLVDARTEPLSFDILRYTSKGYRPTRMLDGWMKSVVLGKLVRVTQTADRAGNPDYRLELR